MISTLKTKINLIKNSKKSNRKLEIGPGDKRILGFETLNITNSDNTDYVLDAGNKLPFKENTFEVIYASHVLEHIPWYLIEETLLEWKRILKKGGLLEIWIPNGYKICKALVDLEEEGKETFKKDGWYRLNNKKSGYVWASGRIFTYGDGSRNISHPNWHRALFTPKYLKYLLKKMNLSKVSLMKDSEIRGKEIHGWINLGIKGTK